MVPRSGTSLRLETSLHPHDFREDRSMTAKHEMVIVGYRDDGDDDDYDGPGVLADSFLFSFTMHTVHIFSAFFGTLFSDITHVQYVMNSIIELSFLSFASPLAGILLKDTMMCRSQLGG
jgi:hypothetical protein